MGKNNGPMQLLTMLALVVIVVASPGLHHHPTSKHYWAITLSLCDIIVEVCAKYMN